MAQKEKSYNSPYDNEYDRWGDLFYDETTTFLTPPAKADTKKTDPKKA